MNKRTKTMSEDIQVTEEKGKTGPKGPRKNLDDFQLKQLKELINMFCTVDECCSVLDMGSTTLDTRLKEHGYANFRDFHKKEFDIGKTSLRRAQWSLAESGNATMQVWLGKQYLGQKDKTEITGENGGSLFGKIECTFLDPPTPE